MKIVRLTAENVKRLRAVEITPDGNLVVIGGRNGAGKTSVLDSIWYALGGDGAQCQRPVRDGEEKAKVKLDLEDLVVTRTMTAAGGGTLTVVNRDGAKHSSPQSLLNSLVGKLAFDPLEFVRMRPRDQLTTLKDLVGLDLTALDKRREEIFASRTAVNRDAKACELRLEKMPDYPNAPKEEVSITEIAAELTVAQTQNSRRHNIEREIERKVESNKAADEHIAGLRERVKELEARIETLLAGKRKCQEEIQDLRTTIDQQSLIDIQPIQDRLRRAEAVNIQVRANMDRAKLTAELVGAQKRSENLTTEISKIDREKEAAIAAARFPIKGLGLGAEGVAFNGLPFDQISSAEQLRVSVAMGLAMNPKLKVLLIRDGSLLDEDSLRMVADMAAAADAQVWLERVGKGKECQVIIEDGEVETPCS